MVNQTALDLEGKQNLGNETITDAYNRYTNNSIVFNQTLAVDHDGCPITETKKKQKFVTFKFLLYHNYIIILFFWVP